MALISIFLNISLRDSEYDLLLLETALPQLGLGFHPRKIDSDVKGAQGVPADDVGVHFDL